MNIKNVAGAAIGEAEEQEPIDEARLKENGSQARLIVDKNIQQLDQTMSKLL